MSFKEHYCVELDRAEERMQWVAEREKKQRSEKYWHHFKGVMDNYATRMKERLSQPFMGSGLLV